MKKRNLWVGMAFIAIAALCFVSAFVFEPPWASLLYGLTGGWGAPGIVQVYKYLKWSRPENAAAYQERLEQERIELRDERKTMLRDKSGRYAYIFNLLLTCAVLFVVSVLGKLQVISGSRWLILFLAVWLLVQYAAGLAIYWLLDRKY